MSNRTKLKKKLWKLISLYVRTKDADSNGYVSCVTCGITKHYKEFHAGHFIPQAQGDAVRYDIRNIHVQCYRCNINLGGNGPEYYPFMLKTYGEATINELRRLSNETVKYTESDLEDMIESMTNMLEEL